MANTNYPSSNEPQKSTVTTSRTTSNNNVKNILIGVLAVALIGTWALFLYQNNEKDAKIESTQAQANYAMSSRDSIQLIYNDALTRLDSITGNNNNLQGQLSESQSEIGRLKSEINSILRKRNATQAELTRAKSLISTLNGKIANLEAEVARLTGENQELAAANTHLTEEKTVLQTNLQTTTTEKEELARTVDVASTFAASNIQIRPIQERKNGKERTTSTARRVDKLSVTFDVENRVARSGPADIYVIVTAPDGQVISNPELGSGTLTTRTDGDRAFTSKNTIQYQQGTRLPVQITLRQEDFKTGNYKIEIYQNGFKIAEGLRSLKKGGIFG